MIISNGVQFGNGVIITNYDLPILYNLYTWGGNNLGALGTGSTVNQSSPVQPAGGGTNWSKIAGSRSVAAIKTDGTLWTWGYNALGGLGNNSTANTSSPSTVAGGGTTWSQVSVGRNNTAAIKTDGTLWTCGYNSSGCLGNGSTANTSSFATVAGGGTTWSQISCGYTHTAAIKTDGTLWTCGYNNLGQLGNNSTANRSSFVTVAGGGTTWSQVAGGSYHTAAVKTDGTLWTWGQNGFGGLGNGTTANRSSPGTVAGGGTTWRQVAAGSLHTVAIKTDGTLWTWGYNASGQLGNGSTATGSAANTSSPGTVAGGGTTWSQVSTLANQAAAIKTDGTLWTWGDNSSGQLGTGTTTNRNSPGTIVGGGTTWTQLACAYQTVLAISTS